MVEEAERRQSEAEQLRKEVQYHPTDNQPLQRDTRSASAVRAGVVGFDSWPKLKMLKVVSTAAMSA